MISSSGLTRLFSRPRPSCSVTLVGNIIPLITSCPLGNDAKGSCFGILSILSLANSLPRIERSHNPRIPGRRKKGGFELHSSSVSMPVAFSPCDPYAYRAHIPLFRFPARSSSTPCTRLLCFFTQATSCPSAPSLPWLQVQAWASCSAASPRPFPSLPPRHRHRHRPPY